MDAINSLLKSRLIHLRLRVNLLIWKHLPPDLQRFSNCSYDEYEYTFSPIKSALYYHDGIAEEVPVDDPRLYMLLNYIMYSENNSSSWVRQGYIGIDEIEDHFGNCPQLEIHFRCDGSPKDDILGDIPHIIITGATVLLFEDNDHIEQHWPYMELRRDMVKIGIVSEEEFTNEMDSDYLGTPCEVYPMSRTILNFRG